MNLARGSRDDIAAGQVFLAAFGKHPGWDDHIEDIGIETEHLASIKQLLYVQGIGGTIDAGAWEDLSDAQRVDGFEHVLLCRTPGDLVLARLWSSTDGKGRSKYPMVVCAQCSNLPLDWVLANVLPQLAEVETRCKAATTADEVVAIIGEARQKLRDLAATRDAGDAAFCADPADLAALADRPEMLDNHEGLLRILYQMDRETEGYSRGNYAAAKNDSLRPVQMRLPACGQTPAEIIPRWLSFLLLRLDPAVEIWTICRDGRDSLDVIIGEPAPNQFFCFQASTEALPLASEIPYTLDDEFRTRTNQLVDDARSGKIERVELKTVAAAPKRIRKEVSEVSESITSLGQSKNLRIALIVAVALAVVAGLVALVVTFWPPPASRPMPETNRNGGNSSMAPAAATAWRDLCLESFNWFAPFVADANQARLARWKSDPHLAATIVPVLSKALAGDLVLDPRRIASVTGRHLKNLAEVPPPGARTPEGIEKTARAVEALAEIRDSLKPEAWPALAKLQEFADTYRKRNWLLQANYLDTVVTRAKRIAAPEPTDQPPDLAERVDDVLAASERAAELETVWNEVQVDAQTLRQSGSPVLAKYGDYVAANARSDTGEGSLKDLGHMIGRLKDARSLGEPLVAFVKDDWQQKVDMPMVAKDPLLSGPVAPADLESGAVFPRWLASIRSERFARLDPAADPRTRGDWTKLRQEEIASLAGKIDELKKKYSSPDAAALAEKLADLQAAEKQLLDLRWDREHKSRIAEKTTDFETQLAQLSRQIGSALAQAAGGREAYVANIPQKISAASEQINNYWRQLLRELVKLDDMAALTIKVEKLEKDLVALDGQLPQELSVQPGEKDWNRTLAGEVTMQHREQVMGEVLAALGWKNDEIVRDAEFETKFNALKAGYDAWRTQATAVMARFNAIDDALRLGAGLDEKLAGTNKTIAESVATFEAEPIWKDQSVVAAVEPVMRRVIVLEQIAKMTAPAKLAAEAAAIATDHFENGRAVWKRLGKLPNWPDDRDQFNIERNLHRDLSNVYAQIAAANPARARQLNEELVAGVRKRWETYFLNLTDPRHIDVAVARMAQYFLDPNQAAALSPACAFRLALRELRQEMLDVPAGTDDEQAVRRRARQFVADIKQMQGIAARKPVADLLGKMSAIAAAKDEGADLTKAGPARVGWTPTASRDGRSVRFDSPAGAADRATLEFVRVEPKGKPAGYVCTSEASVGLFLQIAGGKNWVTTKKLLALYDPAGADPRLGPRTWRLGTDGAPVVTTQWVKLPRGFTAAEFYYTGAKIAPPSASMPVQYLSPAACVYFASLLGCRLPASDEWAAAAAMTPNVATGANRRDKTWQQQKLHIQKLEEAGRLSIPEDHYPDAGAFWPKGARGVTGRDARSGKADDGVLWLTAAGGSKPGEFQNLVGNVAEFTFDDPSALAKWAGDVDHLKRILTASAGRLHVIGGSALSAPDIPTNVPQQPDLSEAASGYADVGLRLAFTAPAETIHTRLRRLLTETGYPALGSE